MKLKTGYKMNINSKQMRSQSVGGIGVSGEQELNEFRKNFSNFSVINSEKDITAEELLNKNLFNMDESGKIVNYLINPPDQFMSKQQFVQTVLESVQNKVTTVQIKQLGQLKQIITKNLENVNKSTYKVSLPDPFEQGI